MGSKSTLFMRRNDVLREIMVRLLTASNTALEDALDVLAEEESNQPGRNLFGHNFQITDSDPSE